LIAICYRVVVVDHVGVSSLICDRNIARSRSVFLNHRANATDLRKIILVCQVDGLWNLARHVTGPLDEIATAFPETFAGPIPDRSGAKLGSELSAVFLSRRFGWRVS